MSAPADQAERTLRATLALADIPFGPDDAEGIHAVGRMFFDRGDHQDAMHVFRLLALVAPSQPRSWTALGSCHEVLGDFERARALYMIALSLPGDELFKGHAAVNKARLDLEADDVAGAERALDAIDPEVLDDVALLRGLAELRARLRRAS